MRSNPTPEITEKTETRRCGRDEGGFVLPWLALMLIVLVAMAGFGVDVWNWWYSAQKMQRAADAGALAGVTLMPDLTAAGAKAHDLVVQNGYSSSTAVQGAKTNQLVVTVDDTVNNYFTSLLGLSTTKLKRSATAEFNAPVSMGAPRGYAHLANDPEKGSTDQHWLNIGAPAVDKQTGDRFADKTNCGGGAYACNGVTNTEYIDGTYIYTVDVETVPADIQVYDPAYANGEQNCTNQWLSTDQIAALELQRDPLKDPIPAGTRYAGGGPPPSPYCTGDDSTNLNKPQATAWIVRDSVKSSVQALVNDPAGPSSKMGGVGPSGSICAHQFDGYTPNSDHYWFDKLNSTDLTTYDPDFYKSFHRWYTMCHVTTAGRYFIQVRASVPFNKGFQEDFTYLTKPEAPPEDLTLGGQNRYSLRIVDPGTNNYSLNSSAYSVARLPVYTNTVAGQNPTFYLARLLPGNNTTGRILNLEFYDIGDVGGTTTLTILPPPDAKGGVPDCNQWIFNGDVNNKAPAGSIFTGCTLTGITTAGYNGVLVSVKVKVPGTYTCDVSSDTGCWFKIFMAYSKGAQANDTTTWGASIGGDPVRLVK